MSQPIKKILIAIFVLVGLSACGSRSSFLSVPGSVKSGEIINLQACSYKSQKIKYAADCGDLVVSENRSDPGTRLITLPVIRVHALDENPAEPIFWLAGGPGSSNIEFSFQEELVINHDIVLVGYRGVDGSIALDCPELSRAAKGSGPDLLSETSLANFGEATRTCAERLESEGVDLDGYSLPEIVEDLEDARNSLGYEQINLLSSSYGTRVAMFYAWMHPEKLHRSVMVAVNPPGHFVWEPEVLDDQIAYDSALCAKDPHCSVRTDDLAESMRSVLLNIPERWLGIPIDPGKVGFMTHFMLFHRGTAATLFDAYLAAEAGDPSGLALMSLAYDFMVPSLVTWGDWIAKGSIDYDPGRDWISDMNPPGSVMGSPTSLLVGGAAQLRGGWPVAPMPDEFKTVQSSEVATLLVSGSNDYSTPAQFATEELLPALINGTQIILAEAGHSNDLWGAQPEAITHLLATFFNTGQIDDSLFTYTPMDFQVGLGFPALAKILILILTVLIIGLVLMIAKRIRNTYLKEDINPHG